jgi:N-acetylglucosamine-6-phosphate deacetylase
MSLLVHRARLLDCNGSSDDSWLLARDGIIVAAGIGETWRGHFVGGEIEHSAEGEIEHSVGGEIEHSAGGEIPRDVEVVDASGRWVVPGFIDLHVHGGGATSFEDGPEAMMTGLAAHRRHGTTRSLVSLVSNPLPVMSARLAEISDLCQADATVLGAHLEGPFLAAERRGAHDLTALRTPDISEIEGLLEAGAGRVRQMTLAPELPGAREAISCLVEAGVVVALGHTAADYDTARAAFDNGATLLTHAFNGMPGIHHRAPGPVLAAFDNPDVTLEIINDGRHVAASVIRLAFGAAPGRIALVSDAMAAAGAADGDYRLGTRDVTVRDGTATLAGTDTLAGSTLTLDDALRRAIAAGIEPTDAVAALTSTPAGVLGLGDRFGQLRPGYAADLVVLDDAWTVQRVITSAP